MPSEGDVVNKQNQGVRFDIRQHSSPFTSLLEGWDVLLQPPFPKQISQKLNLPPLLSVNVSLLKDSRRQTDGLGSRSFGSSEFAVRALPLRIRSSSVKSVRRTTSVFFNSRSDPTKLEPLSHRNSFTSPLRFIKRLKHIMNSSVSIELTTSRCTLPMVKQVNKQHHRFAVPWPCFT